VYEYHVTGLLSLVMVNKAVDLRRNNPFERISDIYFNLRLKCYMKVNLKRM
jgi:hypothetical protein